MLKQGAKKMICVKCGANVPPAAFCLSCGWKQSKNVEPLKDLTLQEVYTRWSKQHYRRIAEKTKRGYQLSWKKLEPYYSYRFADLDIEDYQQVVDSVKNQSYSLQHQFKTLVTQLCKWGIMYQIITINFGNYLYLSGKKGRPRNIFSDEQIKALIVYAENKGNLYWNDARIVLAMIFTGYRPQEFFSILKEEIDIKQKYILTKGSKTEAGRNRVVPISNIIYKYILEWYLRTAPGDTLIKTLKGCPMTLRNWSRRHFYPLMSELQINDFYWRDIQDYEPNVVPYSCRHTFASLCYRAKMRPEIITKIIGHTDFNFTNRTYIHQQLHEYEEEICKMDQLVNEFL